jgi:endonuclease G, mitochondrial
MQASEAHSDLVGRKALVLGYPMTVAPGLPEGLRDAVFGPALGHKAVMPGQFLANRNTKEVTHDASTTSGVAGGPIIDEVSGLVVGVHLQGQWLRDRKENQGPSISALPADPEFQRVLKAPRTIHVPDATAATAPATAPSLVIPYNPRFLGIEIPLPKTRPAANAKLLDYVHFSVLFDQERRMPLYAAMNVDRNSRLKLARAPLPWGFDKRIATARRSSGAQSRRRGVPNSGSTTSQTAFRSEPCSTVEPG